jgi:hypothetical protein
MSELRALAQQISEEVIRTHRPIVVQASDIAFSFGSLRVALTRIRAPVKTMVSGDSMVISESESKLKKWVQPQFGELVEGSQQIVINNRLKGEKHNLEILASVKLLIQHGVLESYTIVGLTEADFKRTYPDHVEWFETVEKDNNVILL